MKSSIALVVLATVGGCSAPESRSPTELMDAIESQVKLPDGASPMAKYARFYARNSSGQVIGVYVIPYAIPLNAECSQGQADGSLKPIDCATLRLAAWEKVKADERRWLARAEDLPPSRTGAAG